MGVCRFGSSGLHRRAGAGTFKIGIVSFLSRRAAESFGIPAVNGAGQGWMPSSITGFFAAS
jgi:hypothetical protein